MRRFFFDPDTRNGDLAELFSQESRHVSRVLRLPPGTSVELLDGRGNLFSGQIESIGKSVHVRILERLPTEEGLDKRLTVYQGILKGEKMDMVVQKSTELGVSKMVPFHSARCQGKLNPAVIEKKNGRWQRISLSACKQCYRVEPMLIVPSQKYDDIFLLTESSGENPLKLLFWEEEQEVHISDISGVTGRDNVEILLGPEGGLSAEEVEQARSYGWQTVSLGKRILRAETATLTAVSILQYLTGKL